MSAGRERELAVLIVSYRRADLLDRALASVEKYLPDCRVHVWDNRSAGSPDVAALAERRPDVEWTFSESNVGSVAATNRLAAQVPECDMLQLHPDAELLGPLLAARAELAQPGVAAVSPTVEDPEGDREPWDVARRDQGIVRNLVAGAGWARTLRGRPVVGRLSDLYPATPHEVDGYLAAGCLLVSRDAWTALGGFDEQLFVYGEDATWQPRARAAGWSLRLVDDPDPQVRHAGAGTVADDPLASRRAADLLRTAQVLVLGHEGNRGRGSVYSVGATLLERVQRTRNDMRRRRLAAQAEDAAGRPSVVVTTNGLRLGGAERQRVLLANALVARGHPVTLVCLQTLGLYTAEIDPRVRLLLQPWWHPVVDVPPGDAIVVGGVTNTEIAFALAWRAQGRFGGGRRRWLPATHDPALLDEPTYSAGQAAALRTADGLLVLSRRHHADLTRHQRLTDTVMVAPNGIPAAEPRPFRSGADGPLRFGMLTRIKEYKNPLLLAEALDALGPDRRGEWTLDIFGDGPDKLRLEARTPEHLRDRVRWRGSSPGPDHAFGEVDVLCVPSGFEAFPLVMVEAMTRAVPVMASASGSVGEMLDEGRAGVVVEPVTARAWTAALRTALDDPDGLRRLGEAGRERALALYTDAAMVDDYQRAFARVLGRPIPGGPTDPARVLR